MYLLWLRVAAILYAAASITIFPAVLYGDPSRGVTRWRQWCVHLGGLAFFFHFVSVVEMLCRPIAGCRWGSAKWSRCLALPWPRFFFIVWWLYNAIPLGLFALPVTFFMVFVPALGPDRYAFPSEGVRTSWLIAHIAALLLAYAALGFSLLASVLYLVQERRIKSKPGLRKASGADSRWAPLDSASAARHP